MSTIVGTNIEVTNLKYDSDTTSMIISNAGQVSIKSEGQANTTNLQQGLAKAWIFCETDNSNLVRDSFNVSTLRDNAAGQHGITLTTAMGNDDWTCQVAGTGGGTSHGYATLDTGIWGGSGDKPYRSTTQVNFRTINAATNDYADHSDVNVLCHGDLA